MIALVLIVLAILFEIALLGLLFIFVFAYRRTNETRYKLMGQLVRLEKRCNKREEILSRNEIVMGAMNRSSMETINRLTTDLNAAYSCLELALDPERPLTQERAREMFVMRPYAHILEGENKSVRT